MFPHNYINAPSKKTGGHGKIMHPDEYAPKRRVLKHGFGGMILWPTGTEGDVMYAHDGECCRNAVQCCITPYYTVPSLYCIVFTLRSDVRRMFFGVCEGGGGG